MHWHPRAAAPRSWSQVLVIVSVVAVEKSKMGQVALGHRYSAGEHEKHVCTEGGVPPAQAGLLG